MNINMKTLLRDPLFSNAKILAGERGLKREVKRISVFDCPYIPGVSGSSIMSEGDLFITCLEQFKDESSGDAIRSYFDCLIKTKSAGLFIVTDDRLNLISDEVIDMCDKSDFPVILIKENYPYAVILDLVYDYISFDMQNTVTKLKFDKIMYGKDSPGNDLIVLRSIKPSIEAFICSVSVSGNFTSDIADLELHRYYLDRKNDIYARTDEGMIILLSEDTPEKLESSLQTCVRHIREFMDNTVIGYSRIHKKKDCKRALLEAVKAEETAIAMKIPIKAYRTLSTLQLLMEVKYSEEAEDYYDTYIEMLSKNMNEESIKDMLTTVETYVENHGDFEATAKIMNQHVNTIRYRLNKVKSALEMEDDTIKFHETIAIASKLRILLGRKI
jgi:hypothetical protein